MKARILISAIVLMAAFSLPAFSQDASTAMLFSRIDHDPVTTAMGGAGKVNTRNVAMSSFRSSAVIPFYEGLGDFALSYQDWAPSGSRFMSFGGAVNIKKKLGIAIGASYGMGEAFEATTGIGSPTVSFRPYDLLLNLGVSCRLVNVMSLGVNVHHMRQSLYLDNGMSALSADLLLMAKLGGVKLSAGVCNLGNKVESASGPLYRIPASAAFVAGYEILFADRHAVEAEVDADWFFNDGVSVSAGICYVFNDMISARLGCHFGSFLPDFVSVGLGVKFFGVRLDASYYFGSDSLSGTFAAGLGYSF